MEFLDCSDKYCVIGAGSSGLAAAKNLKQYSIPFDCFEREDEVGGNWYYGKPHSSVYKSTHLISSKPGTEYVDFPMPKEYPDYPSHAQVWEYFRSYARHFGLYDHITFNIAVEKVEKAGEFWDISLSNGETRRYKGVVIANGHNWDPKFPKYPGKFSGTVLHSGEYKTSDALRDKRVLVVGAGNSGCDIAVESAQNAAKTYHSSRRGYYYVPKYAFGKPVDQIAETALKFGVPLPIRRVMNGFILQMVVGKPQDYGLPKPDHKFYQTHPIINSQMLYYVGHGEIIPKPDVSRLYGNCVRFTDGSEVEVDVIVYATGFNITFPFIDKKYLNWDKTHPRLYMNVFHPEYDNLFVIGLIQPDSGQWGLVDYQSRLMARFIDMQAHDKEKAAAFRQLKTTDKRDLSRGIKYLESTRHYLEIEHFGYRTDLKKLISRFS